MAIYKSAVNRNNGNSTLALELTEQGQGVVRYKLTVAGNGYGFWNNYGRSTAKVIINGQTVANRTGLNIDTRNRTVTLAEGTTNVGNRASVSFSASMVADEMTASLSGTFNLTQSANRSQLSTYSLAGTAISRAQVGETIQLRINKDKPHYTHTLRAGMGGDPYTIATKTGSSAVNWAIPSNWASKYFAGKTTSYVTLYADTYDGNNLIGTDTVRLDLYLGSGVKPVINSVTVTEANQSLKNLGITDFYQSISRLKFSVRASARDGAVITSYRITFNDQTARGESSAWIFNNTNISGKIPYTVQVFDSRGASAWYEGTVDLKYYIEPYLTSMEVSRADNNDKGANADVSAGHTVIGSPDKNGMNITVHTKPKNGSDWTLRYSATSRVRDFKQKISLGNQLDPYTAYDVRLTLSDQFNTTTAIHTLPQASFTLVLGADTPNVGVNMAPKIARGLDVDGGGRFTEPVEVLGGLQGAIIPNGTDLNTITQPGIYIAELSPATKRLANYPADYPFSLEVTKGIEPIQRVTINSILGQQIYVRSKYIGSNNWSEWSALVPQSFSGITYTRNDGWCKTVKHGDRLLEFFGEMKLVYSSTNRMKRTFTFPEFFNEIPAVILTPRWQSGSVSISQVGVVFSENVTKTNCVFTATGANFKSDDILYINFSIKGKWG